VKLQIVHEWVSWRSHIQPRRESMFITLQRFMWKRNLPQPARCRVNAGPRTQDPDRRAPLSSIMLFIASSCSDMHRVSVGAAWVSRPRHGVLTHAAVQALVRQSAHCRTCHLQLFEVHFVINIALLKLSTISGTWFLKIVTLALGRWVLSQSLLMVKSVLGTLLGLCLASPNVQPMITNHN